MSLPPGARLSLASSGNAEQLLQVLYMYGPGDEIDEEGRPLLHYCVDQKAWSVVHYLLRVGIPIDLKDGNLYTALHNSCKKGCPESVVSFHLCISTDASMTVKLYLLQNGANPRETDSVGSTPLHYACFAGNVDVVRLLLQVGVDINVKCKFGWTPLHYAAERGHDQVVELLLNHGATIEAGRKYNGRVELSAVDMAQSLTIKNKLEVNMLSSLMDGFSL